MENCRDNQGRFTKGHPGFKRKGCKRKYSRTNRDYIAQLLERLDQTIFESINTLKPKDRVKFWLKLHDYLLPKLRRVNYEPEPPEKEITKIIFEVVKPGRKEEALD
jgi:hypothetical protein